MAARRTPAKKSEPTPDKEPSSTPDTADAGDTSEANPGGDESEQTPAVEKDLTPDSDDVGDSEDVAPPVVGTSTPDDSGQSLDGAGDPTRAPDGDQAEEAQHFDGAGNKTTDAGAGEIDAALDGRENRPTPSSAPLGDEPAQSDDKSPEQTQNRPGLTISAPDDPTGAMVAGDGDLIDEATGKAPDPDTMFKTTGSQAVCQVRLLESVTLSTRTSTQRLVMPLGKAVPVGVALALINRARDQQK